MDVTFMVSLAIVRFIFGIAILLGINKIMSTLANLQGSIATLTTNVNNFMSDVASDVADLKNTISGLSAGGTIAQADIDALQASTDALSTKLTAADASIKGDLTAAAGTPANPAQPATGAETPPNA